MAFSKEGPEIALLNELVKAENATVFQIGIMLVCRPRCIKSLRMEEIGNAGEMLHVLLFLLIVGLLNELNWKFGWIIMDICYVEGLGMGCWLQGFGDERWMAKWITLVVDAVG